MTLHIVRIVGLVMLIVLCTFYPFLPGTYDPLAVSLSGMAQIFGTVGLLLIPVGGLWLAYELRKQTRRRKDLPTTPRRYYYGLASMAVCSIVALAVSLGALMGSGFSLSFLTVGLWFYILSRLIPKLKLLKKAEAERFSPAPLYLVFVPAAVLVFQIALAAPATEFSRSRAIARSAEIIGDIEEYRAAYGSYPRSLLALHKDYLPSVVGIEKFDYAPNGDAYNLFFERPTFLFDFGIREIVMYNKLDEHVMVSHAAWILAGAPENLEARQGWHSVHNASNQHWKYFWFD